MKTLRLTIRPDKDLDGLLTISSKRSGINCSEITRDALRLQLCLGQFEMLRKKIIPYAEARG
ncbi:CopG family transcriptional regulator [Candidatus Omnitrophota bacterium]